jgi:hypothetical protein
MELEQKPMVVCKTSQSDGGMDQEEKDKGYSVGYQKPPKHTQFQPGQSGNPKGRPKKVSTVNELLLKELQSRISITINGKSHKIPLKQAMAKQLVRKAASGDLKAARLLLDQICEVKTDTGDHIVNLIQEFRGVHARHEAQDTDEHPDTTAGPKK